MSLDFKDSAGTVEGKKISRPVVTECNFQNWGVFQDKAEQLVAENFGEDNIIELALEALEGKRNNPVDHIVNMPEFKIDSNIEATETLRKVSVLF